MAISSVESAPERMDFREPAEISRKGCEMIGSLIGDRA